MLESVMIVDLSMAPIGYVHEFNIHDNLPDNWTQCDGKLLNVKLYPVLFKQYRTAFGGDGIATFGVPDFRENKLDVNMENDGREFIRTYKAVKISK